MIKEIERKFLVNRMPNLEGVSSEAIIQGYLNLDPEIRIRKKGARYFITKKGDGDLERDEEEYEITQEIFMILGNLIKGNIIEKTRYEIPLDEDLVAEFDIYHGALEGLYTVEVTFNTTSEANSFQALPWFGADVTNDKRYKNKNLANFGEDNPSWGEQRL